MTATRLISSRSDLDDAMPSAVTTDALGPLVPLAANSPTQWIAVNGMILRARIGSEVQGMSTGGSDIDEMGICLEPHETVIGHRRFEHRGQAWTLMAVAGTPDEPWDMTATLHTAGKWATARLRDLFPADLS